MSFARVFALLAVLACASCSTSNDTGWRQESPALCIKQCSAPVDCEFGGDSIHDANNFECVAGMCRYLGCVSDAECTAASTGPMLCRVTAYAAYPVCVPPCTTADDCAALYTGPFASPTLDADNWACEAGACQHLGCNNDAECGAQGACLKPADGTPAICAKYCDTAYDCAVVGTIDANEDNFRCAEHRCEYLGCRNDSECQASVSSGTAVCVRP